MGYLKILRNKYFKNCDNRWHVFEEFFRDTWWNIMDKMMQYQRLRKISGAGREVDERMEKPVSIMTW